MFPRDGLKTLPLRELWKIQSGFKDEGRDFQSEFDFFRQVFVLQPPPALKQGQAAFERLRQAAANDQLDEYWNGENDADFTVNITMYVHVNSKHPNRWSPHACAVCGNEKPHGAGGNQRSLPSCVVASSSVLDLFKLVGPNANQAS